MLRERANREIVCINNVQLGWLDGLSTCNYAGGATNITISAGLRHGYSISAGCVAATIYLGRATLRIQLRSLGLGCPAMPFSSLHNCPILFWSVFAAHMWSTSLVVAASACGQAAMPMEFCSWAHALEAVPTPRIVIITFPHL